MIRWLIPELWYTFEFWVLTKIFGYGRRSRLTTEELLEAGILNDYQSKKGNKMIPTIGRIVLYTLRKSDADAINKRLKDAELAMSQHRTASNGVMVHVGNRASEGEKFPMIITKVWGDTEGAVFNGQVMLDGNHPLWVTSTRIGEPETHGECIWPPRV